MNYDAAGQLRTFIESIKGSPLDFLKSEAIFTKTRLLLEKGNLAQTYPTLKLYCDWCQHVELSRNPVGWSVLTKVDKVLVDLGGDTGANIIQAINIAMSVPSLRAELITLFKANHIETFMFDSRENWMNLLRHLFDYLAQRPIAFESIVNPQKNAKAKKAYKDMLDYRTSRGLSEHSAVKRMYVSLQEANEHYAEPHYCWNIRAIEESPDHHATLIVPIELGEDPENFLY